MASAIDATKPIAGTPTTQSVRDQFATAASEITALQARVPVTWTVGSVPFATSTTALGQDNANLFWDTANSRLGIGTTGPAGKLTVTGAGTAGTTVDTTNLANALLLDDTAGSPGNGGAVVFSANNAANRFGAIHGYLNNAASNSQGSVTICTRRAATDATLTMTADFQASGACANTSGAWTTISARETKQDIEPYDRGLDAILALNPVRFAYRAGTPFAAVDAPSKPLFGLIADEVEPHIPEIVGSTTGTIAGKEAVEIDTLEPGLLVFALINSIKTLKAELDELRAQLAP